jgi:hypothetical protein
LKDILKNNKNILRIKQWFKGACVAPNDVVRPIEQTNLLPFHGKIVWKIPKLVNITIFSIGHT